MDLDTFARLFGQSTDLDYLDVHFQRFDATRNLAMRRWKWPRACILDIGAHWLHQSVLYALEGHQVIAADLANPLDSPQAREIAAAHGIRLLVFEDLSSESVFDSLPADSVDVILFCEILEHLTFNPVAMWKAIYRVLRPGGRIILTTPSYYGLDSLGRRLLRFASGRGGGITVRDILRIPTNSPHWKEYSAREIRSYFENLSGDFRIGALKTVCWRIEHTRPNWKGLLVHDKRNLVPFWREGLYAEIDLAGKQSGITIQPAWDHSSSL